MRSRSPRRATRAAPATRIRAPAGSSAPTAVLDGVDYKSLYIGARSELELNQKNTLLGLGGGIGYDTISAGTGGGLAQPTIECEPGGTAQAECNLSTLSVFVSASQIVNRNMVVGASIDVARLSGYQSNPYRSAIGGDELVAERHPTLRNRQAYAGWLRYYVPSTQTTLIGSYRFYRDTWKVHGHTPEIRIVQLIDKVADASLRYRWHTQDAAFFFRERYATADGICMEPGNLATCYLSDDVKLSSMSTHTIEAKLGITGAAFDLQGRWAGARFEGVLQYVVQYNRFGNAIVAHVGVTVPFSY
jgi:hypothetical protein